MEESKSGSKENLLGREIGNLYRIEELIGIGGMATVYRAVHLKNGNRVAIKIILPYLAGSETFVKRFRREARVGARLSHPNIIKVFDYGKTADGLLFIAMELIEGETLDQYLKRFAPLSLARSLEILKPLCEALNAAHSQNILHRDLKPANIMIGKDEKGNEVIKLSDFGLVKLLRPDDEITEGSNLTGDNEFFGSPHHISPEQLMGYELSPASDLYGLSVTLYQMLTAAMPIDMASEKNFQKILMLKIGDVLTPPSKIVPSLPSAIDKVLLKALASNPQERYQTATEFLNVFQKVALGER